MRCPYYAFLFVDFFFSFFAGLVLAAAGAFPLRHLSTKWYEYIDDRNHPLERTGYYAIRSASV